MYFMHLKGESRWSSGRSALTAFCSLACSSVVLLAEGDHLFGTQFGDAFTKD